MSGPGDQLSERAPSEVEDDERLPQPGALFDGKFRVERVIGRGAMAVVLEATHLQLDDRVALKLLLPRWSARPELVERFMREGRAATRIRSEHVVRVFDVGVALGQPYLVMEYLDGQDLDHLLAAEGPMPIATAIDYVLQACEAIAEAHAGGIVHRDLKPANLFLTRRADGSPRVKVLDFGISKAVSATRPDPRTTEPTAVLGSPHYMSPEQMISATDVDVRSDLWSLGAIVHELLAGRPPFDAPTFAALSAVVLRDPPPPLRTLRPDVPMEVERAVLRCLEKEPSRRFADVAALASALAPYGTASARASAARVARVVAGNDEPIASEAVAPPPRLGDLVVAPPAPRRRTFGYVVAALAFVGIAGWIVTMVARDEARAHEPAPAESVTVTAGSASSLASSAPPPVTPVPSASAAPSASSAPSASAAPRAPRRPAPHHGPARPPRVAPLPDFPVPSAEPNGDAPLLQAPPPASSAPR